MRIAPADPDSAAARVLLAELSAALAGITGDTGQSSFDADDVRGPRAVFLIAFGADSTPLGCGAIRPLDGHTAEIKRMYARPGSGAGAPLLAALEAAARGFGYAAAALSTRRVNLRAVGFYAHHGYTETAPYGRYAGRAESVCLSKALTEG
ncbi:MAG: GNAT family N-acetyltransferase [Telluria sp.]